MLCSKQDGECVKKWNAWVSQRTNWLQGSRNGAKKIIPRRRLVVEANILIRAVLGRRVRLLIADACDRVSFYVAEANYDEATHYLAELAPARGISEVV
ncbi:MAG: PIN domain-containing protein [Acidithiobacillus sp.]